MLAWSLSIRDWLSSSCLVSFGFTFFGLPTTASLPSLYDISSSFLEELASPSLAEATNCFLARLASLRRMSSRHCISPSNPLSLSPSRNQVQSQSLRQCFRLPTIFKAASYSSTLDMNIRYALGNSVFLLLSLIE